MGIMRRERGLVGYIALGGLTLLFLGLALVLLRVPAHAAVQVLTVTTTADDGPNPCVGSVCPTLRDALSLAATMTSDGSNPIEIDLPSGTITLSQGVLAVGSATDLVTRIKGATQNAGDSVVQQQVTPTTSMTSPGCCATCRSTTPPSCAMPGGRPSVPSPPGAAKRARRMRLDR